MQTIKQSIKTIILATIIGLAVTYAFAAPWTGPADDPPLDNVDTPINVSTSDQSKSGSLTIGGLFQVNDWAVFLDKVIVNDTVPSTGGEQDLILDVEGAVGATSYCDQDGNDCFVASAIPVGGEPLKKLSPLYRTTTCTVPSGDPYNCLVGSVTLGIANLVAPDSATTFYGTCNGGNTYIQCASSNTFIGYSVDPMAYNNYSQSFSGSGGAYGRVDCNADESLVSGGQTGCPSEADETLDFSRVIGNGWEAQCGDADGGGVSFTINITCAE